MASRARTQLASLPRGDQIALSLLALLAASLLAFFFLQEPLGGTNEDWQGPHVTSDGWYYFHQLRSLVFDQDLDLSDEYRRHGNWYGFGETRTGRPANPFGIGPALLWLPGFSIGHGIASLEGSEVTWR